MLRTILNTIRDVFTDIIFTYSGLRTFSRLKDSSAVKMIVNIVNCKIHTKKCSAPKRFYDI